MLEWVKKSVKLAAGAVKAGKVVQAKAKAFTDDTDLDGIPQWEEIKAGFPVLIADGKAYALKVKDFALLCWDLVLHVAAAGDKEEAGK